MCLAIPGKVVGVKSNYAMIEFPESKVVKASTQAHKPKKGAWVLVYSGFIVESLPEKRAKKIIETFRRGAYENKQQSCILIS